MFDYLIGVMDDYKAPEVCFPKKRPKVFTIKLLWCRLVLWLEIFRPRQNGPDDIFKSIFLNEHMQISIKISQKFVPNGPINNIPALVYIMAWCRSGDNPLSEPMLASLLTRICVTQWVRYQSNDCWCSGVAKLGYHLSQHQLWMINVFLLVEKEDFNFLRHENVKSR